MVLIYPFRSKSSMRYFKVGLLILKALTLTTLLPAQSTYNLSTTQALEKISTAIDQHSPLIYAARMRFKQMGGDTVEIRDFTVGYQTNDENRMYGYDWLVTETIDSEYEYTWLSTTEFLYNVNGIMQTILAIPYAEQIDLGSYPEYLRHSLILKEAIISFYTHDPNDIILTDADDSFTLTLPVYSLATSNLTVDKDSYLPLKVITEIEDGALGLTQITEVAFNYETSQERKTDDAFSIAPRLNDGYDLLHFESTSHEEPAPVKTLTAEDIAMLRHYPLATSDGDTMLIASLGTDYILLDFWFSSCRPCLNALPAINQISTEYADKGLTVVGINCFDLGIKETLTDKLRAKHIDLMFLFGARDLTQSLGINSFPTYLLIKPDLTIEFINGGTEGVKEVLGDLLEK